jgi:hypothetical protein
MRLPRLSTGILGRDKSPGFISGEGKQHRGSIRLLTRRIWILDFRWMRTCTDRRGAAIA